MERTMSEQSEKPQKKETQSLPFAISVLLLIGGVILIAMGGPGQGLVLIVLAIAIMVIRMAVKVIDRN